MREPFSSSEPIVTRIFGIRWRKEELRVEKRAHRRVRAPEGLYLAFYPNFERLATVCDISGGGVGAEYVTDLEPLPGGTIAKVLLFSEGEKESLRKLGIHLSCRVVYDMEDPKGASWMSVRARRCGLAFESLTGEQQRMLNHLLMQWNTLAARHDAKERQTA